MKPVIRVVAFAATLVVGCQAPQSARHVEDVTSAALTAHRFAPPTFVAGRQGAIWAFASRPYSDSCVETACVRLGPDGQAGVKVTRYQYVGSDWAIVGSLFDHGQPAQEAAEIQGEVRSQLTRQ